MTDQEFRALLADLAKKQAEDHAKTEVAQRRTEAAQQRTEATLRQVTEQLGGLGNKFGSFTEGLAFDSMRRVLKRDFGAEAISSQTKSSRGGRTQEFDMMGVRNGRHNEVFVVEIKSKLTGEELNKTLKKLREFFDFMPHLKGKGMKLYGIVCAVDVRGAMADRVLNGGLYLATAGDENFKLVKPPRHFKPKVFTAD